MKRSMPIAIPIARAGALALLACSLAACAPPPEAREPVASTGVDALEAHQAAPAAQASGTGAVGLTAPGQPSIVIDDLVAISVLLTPGFAGGSATVSQGQLSASVHIAQAVLAQVTDPVLSLQAKCTGIDTPLSWTSPSSTIPLTSSSSLAAPLLPSHNRMLPAEGRQGGSGGTVTLPVSIIWPDGLADGMASTSADYLTSRNYQCGLEAKVSSASHLRIVRAKASSGLISWSVQVAATKSVPPSDPGYNTSDHVTRELPVPLADGTELTIPIAVYRGTIQSSDGIPDPSGNIALSAVAPSTIDIGGDGDLAIPLNPIIQLGPEKSTFSVPVVVGLPLQAPDAGSLEPSFYDEDERRWIPCGDGTTTDCLATDCPDDFPSGLACVATTHFSTWTIGAVYVKLEFDLNSDSIKQATTWTCQPGELCPANLQYTDGNEWWKVRSILASSSTAPIGYAQLWYCGGTPCGSSTVPEVVPTGTIGASAACDPYSNVLKTGDAATCAFQNYKPAADSQKKGWNVGFTGLTSAGLTGPGWGSERLSLSLSDVYCAVWALQGQTTLCKVPQTLSATGGSTMCPGSPQTSTAGDRTNPHGTIFACLNLEIQPNITTATVDASAAPLLTMKAGSESTLTSDAGDQVSFAWASSSEAANAGWNPSGSLTGLMSVAADAKSATWQYSSAPATQGKYQARVYVHTALYGDVLGRAFKVTGVNNDEDTYSLGDGDCNDGDAGSYPGAYDVIGDGKDSNCNGYQDYIFDYVGGSLSENVPAATAPIVPLRVVFDTDGNQYIADSSNNVVWKVDSSGIIFLAVGDGTWGYKGDGGPATEAALKAPRSVVLDNQGNLYIADCYNDVIRKVTPDGIISTVAGSGLWGYSGDGGQATGARLNYPSDVALDSQGNLFIADTYNHAIRKVTLPGSIISTVAGKGTLGYSGDGGQATSAKLYNPNAVALNSQGDLFIADTYNYVIRKVTPGGLISTVAGKGTAGYSGDGGLATNAQLRYPYGVALDSQGDVLIADTENSAVRKVTPDGLISTVAGNGKWGYSGDGGLATNAQLDYPRGVALDLRGDLIISDTGNGAIRKVTLSDGLISTTAGNGSPYYAGDGGPAIYARVNDPIGMASDGQGGLFIADHGNSVVRQVTPGGIISTVAGNGTLGYSGDGGQATSAQLYYPHGVALDSQGNLFIADTHNNVIRKVTPGGTISTVAGKGTRGFSGDGGPATNAQLSFPTGLAMDSQENLFIANSGSCVIRKVTPGGVISTVAGNVTCGFSGDGGPATLAQLSSPGDVALDSLGDLFIADTNNLAIRKVTPAGLISTVAGRGRSSNGGDGGPATDAQLVYPTGVKVGSHGDLFISDYTVIRKVSPEGIISRVAGGGSIYGEGEPATSADLSISGGYLGGVALDSRGRLFMSFDSNGYRVRVINP